jgi:flagellar hook protein FlgE
MVRSLYSGVSGMEELQEKMDVIGNNIANANTTGYKTARIAFEDTFNQTLRASAPGTANTSGTSAVQIGSGVATAGIQSSFVPGTAARTNNTGHKIEDLFIAGEGFFMVRDPQTNTQFATRAGEFHFDENGYLITNGGLRVQGYSNASATATPDAVNTGAIGDIKLDTADRNSPLSSYSIDKQGEIRVTVEDTSIPTFTRGQILLQNFRNPTALVKEGDNLFSGMAAAGAVGAQPATPGTNGLGTIEAGALELSNVDLASEFANLITAQRSFQANARIITTSDEMLQETVNLKR